MEKSINDLPKKYLENREPLEGKIVLSYYKKPELLDEYPLKTKEDLLLEESRTLYKLASDMYKSGILEFDMISIESYIQNLPKTKEFIEDYGGSKELVKSAKAINTTNFESYYDELMKNNYLCDLYYVQKDLVDKYDVMKNEMTAQDVVDYTEYQIENINNSVISKKSEHNDFYLSDDLLNEIINGEFIKTVSFGEYARILDSTFNGLPEKCVTLFSGLSGASKSTFTMSNVVYPLIKQGLKVLVVSNELNFRQYMLMFITIILSRELNYFKITREKLNKAKLTEEDVQMLKKAQDIINNKYNKPIHFIDMNTSSVGEVIKSVRKYSKLGYYLTIYDTAKIDSSVSGDNGQAWQKAIEMFKELVYVAQETSTHLWLPWQIANSADYKRRLSRQDLAESKNIITMITNHGILRRAKPEEIDKESKFYCNPYRLTYNEALQKWVKEKIELDKDKKYVIVYIDKTRFSQDGNWIIYQFDGAWSTFRELGYCVPVADAQRN